MYRVLVDKQTYCEIYNYLQDKFCGTKNYNLLLLCLFWASKYLILFKVIRLLKLVSFLSKSALVTKLACSNFAVKFSAVNLLNSGVVIYLARSYFILNFSNLFIKNSCGH